MSDTPRAAALATVEAYRARNNLLGTLEALMAMAEEIDNRTLSDEDEVAYRIVFAGFRELFHGRAA